MGSATAVTCVTRKDTVCTVKEVGAACGGRPSSLGWFGAGS